MSIRIENRCQNHSAISAIKVEAALQRLLRRVPPQDLVGLEAIILVDQSTDRKIPDAAGLYRQKRDQQPATIEIAVSKIYGRMPRIVTLLPFIKDLMLAGVLYHEIGHHYHRRFTHSVRKHEMENFANQYRTRMLRKAFFWWRLVLIPVAPLVHWLSRLVNKWTATHAKRLC